MNELVKSLGFINWQVVWQPNETQQKLGRIIPENRIIMVHDLEAKAAMRTVLHEIIELKLRPAFNVQRSLSNALLEWANTQVYKAKERAIEDLLDIILSLVEGSDEVRSVLEGARAQVTVSGVKLNQTTPNTFVDARERTETNKARTEARRDT